MKTTTALVLLCLAVGCGRGGADTQARTAYLKQAEAICAQANAEQKALTTPLALPLIAPYVAKIVAIADEATRSLSALSAPAADKQQLEAKVLGPLRAQLVIGHAYADKVSAAARENNQAELTTLLGNPPTKTKADLRWMKNYGFATCVEAADTSR